MRVEAAEVQLQAKHETNRAQIHSPRMDIAPGQVGGSTDLPPVQRVDAVELSRQADEIEPECRQFPLDGEELAPHHELELELAKKIVGQLLGSRFKLLRPNDLLVTSGVSLAAEEGDGAEREGAETSAQTSAAPGARPESVVQASYYTYHTEPESSPLQAVARVETADAQEIEVAVELSVHESFSDQHGIDLRRAQAQLGEPVALRFEGNASDLTARSYRFEIDADGITDQLSYTNPEGESLSFASDGPGEAIYDRLRLWSQGEAGGHELMALGDRSLGAVYVGHALSSSERRTVGFSAAGSVYQSGFFVAAGLEHAREGEGGAHVDLVA